MKTDEYFSAIKAQRVALDAHYPNGTVYLTAVANRDSVSEADTDTAARCLVEGTHRLATDDEVAAWQDHQGQNRQMARSTEYILRGQRIVWGAR